MNRKSKLPISSSTPSIAPLAEMKASLRPSDFRVASIRLMYGLLSTKPRASTGASCAS